MKNLILFILICLFLFPRFALSAEIRVAVIDLEAAISASNAAQAVEMQMDKEFEAEKENLISMQTEIDDLIAKLTKEGKDLSKDEKDKLNKKIRDKKLEYEILFELVDKRTDERYEELVGNIDPLIQQAIKEVLESGEYDIVHERKSILHFSPGIDISQKLTDRLNQLTANSKVDK